MKFEEYDCLAPSYKLDLLMIRLRRLQNWPANTSVDTANGDLEIDNATWTEQPGRKLIRKLGFLGDVRNRTVTLLKILYGRCESFIKETKGSESSFDNEQKEILLDKLLSFGVLLHASVKGLERLKEFERYNKDESFKEELNQLAEVTIPAQIKTLSTYLLTKQRNLQSAISTDSKTYKHLSNSLLLHEEKKPETLQGQIEDPAKNNNNAT